MGSPFDFIAQHVQSLLGQAAQTGKSAVQQAGSDISSTAKDVAGKVKDTFSPQSFEGLPEAAKQQGQDFYHALLNPTEAPTPKAASVDPALAGISAIINGRPTTESTTAGDVAKSTDSSKKTTKTKPTVSTSNELQSLLDKAMQPYFKMYADTMNAAAKGIGGGPTPDWVPESVRGPLENFQKLTGSSLKGLVPETKAAEKNFVAASATQQLLNILPTAMLYHQISEGSGKPGLPGFSKSDTGLQALWTVLQQMNMGIPNPQDKQGGTGFSNFISSLPNPGTGTNATDSSSGSTGG